jgi:predicted neutral ceramidase superfamily lipid hydrolase
MRRRTAVVLAGLLISAILGLQALEVVMRAATNRWMEQGVVIPLYGRVLLGVALFWVDFKWLLALPIIIAFLLIALLARREASGVGA